MSATTTQPLVNNVCCYYEDLELADGPALLALWRSAWTRQGWTVTVLGPSDAQRHPSYGTLCHRASNWRSRNGRGFELACFVRWLAFATLPLSQPTLATDFDVFPRTAYQPHAYPTLPYNGSPARDPGCIVATAPQFQQFVTTLLSHTPAADHDHVSDMTILHDHPEVFPVSGYDIECYNRSGWLGVPLTHFGGAHMLTRLPRSVEIARVLQLQQPPVTLP